MARDPSEFMDHLAQLQRGAVLVNAGAASEDERAAHAEAAGEYVRYGAEVDQMGAAYNEALARYLEAPDDGTARAAFQGARDAFAQARTAHRMAGEALLLRVGHVTTSDDEDEG